MKIDSVTKATFLLLLVHKSNSGWVDPDTSAHFQGTAALTKGDNREYHLVSCYTLNVYYSHRHMFFLISTFSEC